MLDIYRTRTRIEEINKRLRILNKKFKPMSENELIEDESLNAEAERHLEVALQAAIDIGGHIISSLGLQRPSKELKEIFYTLVNEGIIPRKLGNRLAKSVGYRNIIVHDYLDIDRHETFVNIQEKLPDLTEYTKHIENFLEKYSS